MPSLRPEPPTRSPSVPRFGLRLLSQEHRDRQLVDAVDQACLSNSAPMVARVRRWLARGANPNTPLRQADPLLTVILDRLVGLAGGADEAQRLEVVTALLEAGADPNARRDNGHAPVHLAAQRGQWLLFEALVTHGADPFATCRDGTPLHVCTEARIVRWLLDHGADATLEVNGQTPLAMAQAMATHERLHRQVGGPGEPAQQHHLAQLEAVAQMLEAHVLLSAIPASATPVTPSSSLTRSRL